MQRAGGAGREPDANGIHAIAVLLNMWQCCRGGIIPQREGGKKGKKGSCGFAQLVRKKKEGTVLTVPSLGTALLIPA
jgi:hypothetical protein